MQHRRVGVNESEEVRDHEPSFARHRSPKPLDTAGPSTARLVCRGPTLEGVSIAGGAGESNPLTVVSPTEALERAMPLPTAADMAVEGLTGDEWNAFEHAPADQ